MLLTIAIVLMLLWAVGLITSYTLGGYLHLLVVVALAVLIVSIVQRRRLPAG